MMNVGLLNVDAVSPDEMADLFFFESRLLPLSSAAAAAVSLCEGLLQCSRRWPAHLRITGPSAKIEEEIEWLENHRNKLAACSNHATALLTKCERAVQLLDRILNLKSQKIAQQQNTNILALTKSTVDDSATVRVMTAITLVYLSCTVVAVSLSPPYRNCGLRADVCGVEDHFLHAIFRVGGQSKIAYRLAGFLGVYSHLRAPHYRHVGLLALESCEEAPSKADCRNHGQGVHGLKGDKVMTP